MPELPEVETVARFIEREANGQAFNKITFYRQDLREAIPVATFKKVLLGQEIQQVFRRSKYIVLKSPRGYALFHLGMTGNLLWKEQAAPQAPHTHLVMQLQEKPSRKTRYLHFVDPRRFGMIHAWEGSDWQQHPYLRDLGPEPLLGKNLGAHLFKTSRKRRVPIKNFIMDGRIVVGVGNIYACEALFGAGIHPETPCGNLSEGDYKRLAQCIKQTLRKAIAAGGTSFRDYRDSEGKPGYFAQSLQVYGREGESCHRCKASIKRIAQSGRSTWFCSKCQN